jgi:hypothetical protein
VEPFIFGSPLPQHNVTNTQFKIAAASVLEDMNKRLQANGVEGVGMGIIDKIQPGQHPNGAGVLTNRETMLLQPKGAGIKEKFEKMHEEQFSKMEGIDVFAKRKGMSPKKSAGELAIEKKRRSSMVGNGIGRDRFGRRVGGDITTGRLSGKFVSDGRKPRVLPGTFGADDNDDHDDEAEDEKEKTHVGASASGESGKLQEQKVDVEKEKEEEKKGKEREAIKRRLELNKARRRSSVGVAAAKGRVSVGKGGVLRRFSCLSIGAAKLTNFTCS